MTKPIKIIIGIAIGMLALYGVARLTGALQFYNASSPSCEPNIKTGSRIVVTNLKKAIRGSVAVLENPYADSINNSFLTEPKNGQRYLYRLCGFPGDIIEMKDGVFFVNGRNTDSTINLYHFYLVPAAQLSEIDKISDPALSNPTPMSGDSIVMVNLTDEMLRQLPPAVKPQKYEMLADTSVYGVFMWYNKNPRKWTVDNFGPLTVPADHVFYMGDNRTNAMDSRYTGFVKMSDIKGVIL